MKKVLTYTTHKAASMFLHRLNAEIASFMGLKACSINDNHFSHEIKTNSWNTAIASHDECAIFGPIRIGIALPNIPDNCEDHSVIVHIRDPRDVLTSYYFSVAYSHPVQKNNFNPGEQQREKWIEGGIDSFVLNSTAGWVDTYKTIRDLIEKNRNCNVVKYEDMVQGYDRWLIQYLKSFKHLAHKANIHPLFAHCLNEFKDDFKILPEDAFRHKRKMTPGDHIEKLAPETIDKLNSAFSETLDHFGYLQ